MEARGNQLFYSPSDLTAYLACEHLTQLELAVAGGEIVKPRVEDPQAELIRRKGEEHERAYLARLVADGRDVVTIEFADRNGGGWDWERGARATEEALRAGREVIYQAAFLDGEWRGLADFVIRGDDGSCEAYDTKLARHGKPAHVLQLCFYSEQIGRLQGRLPERMHIALGSGETERYRTLDFLAYYRRVRERFLDAVHDRPPTEPYPVEHCSICAFRELCEAWWDEHDHLTRVANIRRDQVVRLDAAGITTLAELGDAPRATDVPRLAATTFENIRHQAELQLRERRTGAHVWETLQPEGGRGFALLPKPSPGDLFFDMEGDPWWEPNRGLEYLFGVWLEDGEPQFRPFWAHDRDGERRAFEQLVDFVYERRAHFPDLHVYHYAPYEPSALKRLMGEYATREEAVDDLLRGEVLVDLYAVVRQGVRISHPSYSIKNVEQFYMEREAELRSGDDSIVLYERWVSERDDSVLRAIEEYNREDCLSTYLLREWLLERKAEAAATWGTEIRWRDPPELREVKPETVEELAEKDVLREGLLAREKETARLAALLLDYHWREAKPVWWAYFRRLGMTVPELVEDAESIGGLEWDGQEPVAQKKSRDYTFTFPVQQHKLDPGDEVVDPYTGENPGTIVGLDDVAGRLRLRRGPKVDKQPLPQALIPGGAWDTRVQRQALMRLGRSVRDGDGRYAGLEGVLRRDLPLDGERVQVGTEDEMKRLVERVEGRHLFVQGPPGSGKTYTGARLILHLLARGKRVGVAATSHKAIHNLLDEIVAAGLDVPGLKKCSGGNPESVYERGPIESREDVEPFLDPGVRLLAGTAWLFARPELDQQLDYLFIDEAGQVSLADVLALGTSARTLVLLGDPLQLAQVSQGTHPDGSGASVLVHLLGDEQTIPEDRGLFLERSFRMHPDVCWYVSDAFYESRLEAAAGCELQSTAAGTGLRFLPVEHAGNRRSSPEEAARMREELDRLLGQEWTDTEGVTRPLGLADVLVVAPFNEQVRCLAEALPRGARIGTVDKFQGQQAPVVFFSMATSSGEDVPRNLEFLLSRNRLNVAVSRAKCLAYVVASPKLLEVGCRSIEQMRMANALCLFVEIAEAQAAAITAH